VSIAKPNSLQLGLWGSVGYVVIHQFGDAVVGGPKGAANPRLVVALARLKKSAGLLAEPSQQLMLHLGSVPGGLGKHLRQVFRHPLAGHGRIGHAPEFRFNSGKILLNQA